MANEFKVGQIRKFKGVNVLYVITFVENAFQRFDAITQYGCVLNNEPYSECENDEIIAEFDSWKEAISSDLFTSLPMFEQTNHYLGAK